MIKLPENSPLSFSGRYIHNTFQKNILRPSGTSWVRNSNDEKGVFILKPVEKNVIEPNEILSFENFQIRWSSTSAFSGSIIGLTYCDEFQNGTPAINSINLSIIKQKPLQEVERESIR